MAPVTFAAVRLRCVFVLPLLAGVASGLLEPTPVSAQPSQGEVLFKEGLTLLESAERTKDRALFDQACDRFARSFAAEELLNPLIHLARCEEGRGQLRAALKAWRAAASLAKVQSDAPGQLLAETAAKDLDAKLPKLVVRLPARAQGAAVDVDGEVITAGEPFIVDPGDHRVRAKLGNEVEEKNVTATQGVLEVELLSAAPKPPGLVAPSSGADLALPGWILLGVGGAAWVATIATSAVYMTRCEAPFECPENAFGGGFAEANLALWVAAPLLSGVGATLLIVDATSGDEASVAPPGPSVGALGWLDGTSAGVRVFGSF